MSAELLDLDALEKKYAGPGGVWQVADVDVLSLLAELRGARAALGPFAACETHMIRHLNVKSDDHGGVPFGGVGHHRYLRSLCAVSFRSHNATNVAALRRGSPAGASNHPIPEWGGGLMSDELLVALVIWYSVGAASGCYLGWRLWRHLRKT